VYRHQPGPPVYMANGDRAAFFQLRTILEGVVARGTAAAMKHLAVSSAARPAPPTTRTTPGLAACQRRHRGGLGRLRQRPRQQTLGRGGTGGQVAVPIVESIIQAAWNLQSSQDPAAPTVRRGGASSQGAAIDLNSGHRLASAKAEVHGIFPFDGQKKLRDTQYALAGRHSLARSGPISAPAMNDDRPPQAAECHSAAKLRVPVMDRVMHQVTCRVMGKAAATDVTGIVSALSGRGYTNRPLFSGNIVKTSEMLGNSHVDQTSTAALLVLTTTVALAASADYQIVKVYRSRRDIETLKPKTIFFTDHRTDETSDKGAFIRFDEWSRSRPVEYKFPDIFPGFKEGMGPQDHRRLEERGEGRAADVCHEARFMLSRRPTPSISGLRVAGRSSRASIRRSSTPPSGRRTCDAEGDKGTHMNPERKWCEGAGVTACIR